MNEEELTIRFATESTLEWVKVVTWIQENPTLVPLLYNGHPPFYLVKSRDWRDSFGWGETTDTACNKKYIIVFSDKTALMRFRFELDMFK